MLSTLNDWLTYFENNATQQNTIPWDTNDELTEQEHQRIKRSIAAFQLGEYSEGKGLLKAAQHYSKAHHINELVSITRCFVKEEQHHASILKRFMDKHNIPVIRKNWTDTIFRRLRRDVGYELSISVLITAEIVALVYYKALRNCTKSTTLQLICEKIYRDELAHVQYESELLNAIRRHYNLVQRLLIQYAHQLLFLGTVTAVFFEHRPVLMHGGYPFLKFWKACWVEFLTYFGNEMKESILPSYSDLK